MSKKLLFIIAAIILLLIVAISIVALFAHKQQGMVQQQGVTFPTSSSTNPQGGAGTLTIPGQASSSIVTKDFIHNGETATDKVNQGNYVLAGSVGYCLADGTCPAGANTKEFTISYSKTDNSFNVVLLQEPLGQARHDAEQFLLDRLGISQKELCALNSYVGIPYFVNENFPGNVGFSFCPGAVKLP